MIKVFTFLTNRREMKIYYHDQKRLKIKNKFIDLRTLMQMKQRRLFFYSYYNTLILHSKNMILHL